MSKRQMENKGERNCHKEETSDEDAFNFFPSASVLTLLGKVAGTLLHVGVYRVQLIASLIVISQKAILSLSRLRSHPR